jgi:anaerobic magnesium-protoporphyrin IX monomethyl ester cyclase
MREVVLLINPGQDRGGEQQHLSPHRIHRDIPPMSILTLGSYLEQQGVDVIVYDAHIDKNYAGTIKEFFQQYKIILVGMTTFVGRFINNAIELGEIIKGLHPDVPIVWGGPLVSALPEQSLLEGNPDYVILHNGEVPLFLLTKTLMGKGEIDLVPNLGYRRKGYVCFNKIDFHLKNYDGVIKWDLLNGKINVRQEPYIAYIFTSRGCPYHCTFCYHQVDASNRIIKRYECRSPEGILDEIDFLRGRYGMKVFTIGDDNFFINRKRVLKILKGIRERGCYIEQCVGTFSNLDDEVIKALSGICQTVICSIESASERLLKEIQRPVDLRTVEPTVTKLCDHGINTYHNFMFGLPGETDEDRKVAVDLAVRLKRINPYLRLIPYFFTPLPGTPLYRQINTDLAHSLEKSLREWGDCEFNGGSASYKYRPWIPWEEQEFLSRMIDLFRSFFVSLNAPLTEEQRHLLETSPRLNYIFQNMDQVAFPPDDNPKYLLDEVLRKEGLL